MEVILFLVLELRVLHQLMTSRGLEGAGADGLLACVCSQKVFPDILVFIANRI